METTLTCLYHVYVCISLYVMYKYMTYKKCLHYLCNLCIIIKIQLLI